MESIVSGHFGKNIVLHCLNLQYNIVLTTISWIVLDHRSTGLREIIMGDLFLFIFLLLIIMNS